ncbi:hypothetical protein D3C80_2088820 [compost metagenome]
MRHIVTGFCRPHLADLAIMMGNGGIGGGFPQFGRDHRFQVVDQPEELLTRIGDGQHWHLHLHLAAFI